MCVCVCVCVVVFAIVPIHTCAFLCDGMCYKFAYMRTYTSVHAHA